MERAGQAFGALLRRWRRQRGLTQLTLSLDAGVSARHLSWLENGRAAPSRAMVLRLADRLDVPLRERNGLLKAAGFAPMFQARALDDPGLHATVQRLLDAHDPWPALAIDRHWNIVASNRTVDLLLQGIDPALRAPPVNALRLSLHPRGLAPMIENLGAWRAHVLARLTRAADAGADATLAALLAELSRYPGEASPEAEPVPADAVAVPLVLRTPFGRLAFLTTVTVFGAPQDVTLSELAVETLLPADGETADRLRALTAQGQLTAVAA